MRAVDQQQNMARSRPAKFEEALHNFQRSQTVDPLATSWT